MSRKMLLDSSQTEETRVAIIDGNKLEYFDYESINRAPLRGNIYLAKVSRVEPSLQAAFVDFGGNRHGFLPFSEIHPDYFNIPVSDQENDDLSQDDAQDHELDDDEIYDDDGDDEGKDVIEIGGDIEIEDASRKIAHQHNRLKRKYKIQEVIRSRQIILVQVIKEERGNKGAALSTYLSLAGRYCVLMPNSVRPGGISRKISNVQDRKRLRKIVVELNIPTGMSIILRTVGAGRSKVEISRDFEYVSRLWNDIRENTLSSAAPALIYEEGDAIKRSLRDLYTSDIGEIWVEGKDGYKQAKSIMRQIMPSHAKKVREYKETYTPLFQKFLVENQLQQLFEPEISLASGGFLIINQTEALVAIDVNSGRSTKERHIEETAISTNLE
ncbi:MAG: ribonuclease E/G, partial [Pseudomonadota bacterium]